MLVDTSTKLRNAFRHWRDGEQYELRTEKTKSLLEGIIPCLSEYALGFTSRDMRIPIDLLPGQADLTLSVTTLTLHVIIIWFKLI